MKQARIAELLEPFLDTPPGQIPNFQDLLSHISTYIDILLRWNARINLTAIRDPEEIVTRHFGESLFAARHLFPRGRAALQRHAADGPEGASDQRPPAHHRTTVADVGSGPGFPGLPIKLWAPQVSLTLIESNHKKATFLREVARALTLTDINIQIARAESLTGATFDVVTLRAVERFETILPAAAALVAATGRLALLLGASQLPHAQSNLPNLTWCEPIPIPKSTSKTLVIASRSTNQDS